MNKTLQCLAKGFVEQKQKDTKKFQNIVKLERWLSSYYSRDNFNVIKELKGAIDLLSVNEKYLKEQIEATNSKAREKIRTKDRKGAMFHLRRRKQMVKQLKNLDGKKNNLEKQIQNLNRTHKELKQENIKRHLRELGCPMDNASNMDFLEDRKAEILDNVDRAFLYYSTKLKQKYGYTVQNNEPCMTMCESKSLCDRFLKCKWGTFCKNKDQKEVRCERKDNVLSNLTEEDRNTFHEIEINELSSSAQSFSDSLSRPLGSMNELQMLSDLSKLDKEMEQEKEKKQ